MSLPSSQDPLLPVPAPPRQEPQGPNMRAAVRSRRLAMMMNAVRRDLTGVTIGKKRCRNNNTSAKKTPTDPKRSRISNTELIKEMHELIMSICDQLDDLMEDPEVQARSDIVQTLNNILARHNVICSMFESLSEDEVIKRKQNFMDDLTIQQVALNVVADEIKNISTQLHADIDELVNKLTGLLGVLKIHVSDDPAVKGGKPRRKRASSGKTSVKAAKQSQVKAPSDKKKMVKAKPVSDKVKADKVKPKGSAKGKK